MTEPENLKDPKKIIAQELQKIEEEKSVLYHHKQFTLIAQRNKCPVLTTNFDKNLIQATPQTKNQNFYWVDPQNKEQTFLTNAYFSNKRFFKGEDFCSLFAIWYIHGTSIAKSYYKSICLTNEDYVKLFSKLDGILNNSDETRDFKSDSWLDIFMNNDLIIFGLGLDFYEIDLRWLLIKRYFYLKERNKKRKTLYIYRKEAINKKTQKNEEMPDDKKNFFTSLGIECIPMETEKIYKFDWISNN